MAEGEGSNLDFTASVTIVFQTLVGISLAGKITAQRNKKHTKVDKYWKEKGEKGFGKEVMYTHDQGVTCHCSILRVRQGAQFQWQA